MRKEDKGVIIGQLPETGGDQHGGGFDQQVRRGYDEGEKPGPQIA